MLPVRHARVRLHVRKIPHEPPFPARCRWTPRFAPGGRRQRNALSLGRVPSDPSAPPIGCSPAGRATRVPPRKGHLRRSGTRVPLGLWSATFERHSSASWRWLPTSAGHSSASRVAVAYGRRPLERPFLYGHVWQPRHSSASRRTITLKIRHSSARFPSSRAFEGRSSAFSRCSIAFSWALECPLPIVAGLRRALECRSQVLEGLFAGTRVPAHDRSGALTVYGRFRPVGLRGRVSPRAEARTDRGAPRPLRCDIQRPVWFALPVPSSKDHRVQVQAQQRRRLRSTIEWARAIRDQLQALLDDHGERVHFRPSSTGRTRSR